MDGRVRLCARMARGAAGLRAVRLGSAGRALPAARSGRMMPLGKAMDLARKGFIVWSAKSHNAKWVRKIEGTPIANDLIVCIAEAFAKDEAPPLPDDLARFDQWDWSNFS